MLRSPRFISCAALFAFSTLACSSGAGDADKSGAAIGEDFGPVLERSVDAVIVPTYLALHEKAQDLHLCVEELAASLSEDQLVLCQKAWVAARVPWEQSEGFLFGPVTDKGLDPSMDSWPVDHKQLDALMASNVTLTAATIASNLGGGLKGFHTIEYLLWGADHNRTAAQLSAVPREVSYLVAVTEALALDTQTLWGSWTGSEEEPEYGKKFASAGQQDGLYSSQLDAVHELIGGMIGICDEVAFGKIAEPHNARDPNLIESQFSYNSLLDFSDNIRSVQNVYLGSLDGSAEKNSMSAIVAKYDPELDEEVRQLIASAIQAIMAIGDGGATFRDAILDPSKDAVITAAEREIGKLMDRLNGDVLPLFAR